MLDVHNQHVLVRKSFRQPQPDNCTTLTLQLSPLLQKMDLNKDGYVSLEEFLESCQSDETISQSVNAFTNVVI